MPRLAVVEGVQVTFRLSAHSPWVKRPFCCFFTFNFFIFVVGTTGLVPCGFEPEIGYVLWVWALPLPSSAAERVGSGEGGPSSRTCDA